MERESRSLAPMDDGGDRVEKEPSQRPDVGMLPLQIIKSLVRFLFLFLQASRGEQVSSSSLPA